VHLARYDGQTGRPFAEQPRARVEPGRVLALEELRETRRETVRRRVTERYDGEPSPGLLARLMERVHLLGEARGPGAGLAGDRHAPEPREAREDDERPREVRLPGEQSEEEAPRLGPVAE